MNLSLYARASLEEALAEEKVERSAARLERALVRKKAKYYRALRIFQEACSQYEQARELERETYSRLIGEDNGL